MKIPARFFFILLITILASCGGGNSSNNNANQTVNVTSVSVSETSITLNIDATATLVATITPANASNQNVTWSSSDDGVATVNASGLVSAIAAGNATITVTTTDGSFTATTTITVEDNNVPATGVSLSIDNANLDVGATITIIANVAPSNASNTNVSWASSNDAIATVTSSGLVTAVAPGNTTITATTADGSFTDTVAITVNTPVNIISISDTSVTEGDAGTANLVFTLTLSAAASGDVTVDVTTTDGTATAGSDYTAMAAQTVTISSGNNTTTFNVLVNGDTTIENDETLTVTLSNPTNAQLGSATSSTGTILNDDNAVAVTGVSVAPTNAAIDVAETTTIVATVAPANASNTDVSWSSADNGIATVSSSGIVTGVAPGITTITVTTDDGSFAANSEITVNAPANFITIADSSVAEGDAGAVNLVFIISLSSNAIGDVNVDVTTTDGSATAGSDYTALTAQTKTITTGNDSTTVAIVVSGDTDIENNETFTVTLSNPVNAQLGSPSVATGTITNDDVSAAPILTAADKTSVLPCPNQAILTDVSALDELKDALLTGALLFRDVPYNGADVDNFKKKCGFEGYWDPANNTNDVTPAGVGMTSIYLSQLLTNGNAGICTTGSMPSSFLEGFPAVGTYRGEIKASKGGSTWHVRYRHQVSGSSAGNTFGNESVSVPADITGTMEYKVNGIITAHNDLFTTLVNTFNTSGNAVVLTASKTVGGTTVLTINFELICVTKT